ncbi:MAG TPA: cytochrome c, partial [Trueperaceae bacterium]|nr:cytochrome c [Trueperaceae bacterium]
AEAARQQASGGEASQAPEAAALPVIGRQVFSANCTVCHGPNGEGGVGATLAGNPRASNEANVRDAVRFGRGLMPAFMAELQPD